jgi:hypothetical protein
MSNQELITFVLDNPEEAALEIEQLRAALQAYVDEAETHLMKGQPGSPFAMRLAAGRAALAMGRK